MNEAAAIGQRARTDEQKELRRRAIMDAADEHLRTVGFEAFSMAELGRLAGVAKGTLYLYFETREEVLLALYCEKLDAWEVALTAAMSEKMSDRQFATAMYDTSYADPMFLPLNSRLDNVIEHNISITALVELKRAMAAGFHRLSLFAAPKLDIPSDQFLDAMAGLGSLLLGTALVDMGPRVDRRKLPKDVKQFMEAFNSREVFTTNACRILAAVRSLHGSR